MRCLHSFFSSSSMHVDSCDARVGWSARTITPVASKVVIKEKIFMLKKSEIGLWNCY